MASPSSDWPPPNGLTTNIVPRESVILPTSASIRINAPAALVFSILTDTSTYPRWCSFCPRVTVRAQPAPATAEDPTLRLDTHFTFHVVMDSRKPTSYTDTALRVTDMSTPAAPSEYIAQKTLDAEPSYSADLSKLYRIAWTTEGAFVSRGLKSERFHEVIVLGEDECEVRTWECQGGSLARAVKWMYQKVLVEKFADWCADLKKEAERLHGEGKEDTEAAE